MDNTDSTESKSLNEPNTGVMEARKRTMEEIATSEPQAIASTESSEQVAKKLKSENGTATVMENNGPLANGTHSGNTVATEIPLVKNQDSTEAATTSSTDTLTQQAQAVAPPAPMVTEEPSTAPKAPDNAISSIPNDEAKPEPSASTPVVEKPAAVSTEAPSTATAPVQPPTTTSNEPAPSNPVTEASSNHLDHNSSINVETNGPVPDKQEVPKILGKDKLKWCLTTLKTLKKHHEAGPFLQPVDPVALGIPDYLEKIKKPMDLSTIEQKLNQSNYSDPAEFVADVRLMLDNCFTYNPPNHLVHNMGRNLEKTFNAQLKRMPQDGQELSVGTTGHPISATSSPASARPRRETHPPAEIYPEEGPNKRRKSRKSDDIKWCYRIHQELMKKQYAHFMFPFYQPVDPVALNIPSYFEVIKHPMDLSTMKKKLDRNEYSKSEEFEADFRQMINNCLTFNRPGDDVYGMGQKAEELFVKKWHEKSLRESPYQSSSTKRKSAKFSKEESDEESSSDEDDLQIRMIEQQISFLQQQLLTMRQSKKRRKDKKRKPKTTKSRRGSKISGATDLSSPAHSSGAHSESKPTSGRGRGAPKKKEPEIREITFDEKRQLSESINSLSGEKLARVVQIIHESMPQLGGASGQEEIELDIDSLDLVTLNRLWNFVKGKKRRARKPETDPVAAASRINELERELARMDGRIDKTKKLEGIGGDNNGSSTEDSDDESGADDSDSE